MKLLSQLFAVLFLCFAFTAKGFSGEFGGDPKIEEEKSYVHIEYYSGNRSYISGRDGAGSNNAKWFVSQLQEGDEKETVSQLLEFIKTVNDSEKIQGRLEEIKTLTKAEHAVLSLIYRDGLNRLTLRARVIAPTQYTEGLVQEPSNSQIFFEELERLTYEPNALQQNSSSEKRLGIKTFLKRNAYKNALRKLTSEKSLIGELDDFLDGFSDSARLEEALESLY